MTRTDEFAQRIVSRTSSGIADEIRASIDDGTLSPGTRLPTIRSLAVSLGVSPTTVTDAWNRLLMSSAIRTEGRRGTFVSPSSGKRLIETAIGSIIYDVAQGDPDPELLPSLTTAVSVAAADPSVHANDFAYITAELRLAVERSWPYPPSAWTTADGGKHASYLAITALSTRGVPVAVEQPTMQRTLNLLHERRRPAVGVEWDDDGPSPDMLDDALGRRGATVFVWQPRGQFPTGRTVSDGRLAELAEVVARHPGTTVIEDDAIGPLASARARSLAEFLPESVVHIRSFDTAYGLDLRTAVISGSLAHIRSINLERGMFGVWNSRILQNALAWLLDDSETSALVKSAARTYSTRRRAMVDLLTERGVGVAHGDGLVLWVPVAEETRAIEELASRGVSSGLGSVCSIGAAERSHIRVPTSRLTDRRRDRERIADLIAAAAAH